MSFRRNKYHASRQACMTGHSHDSGMEARYCDLLHLEMRSKENQEAPPDKRIVEIQVHRTAQLTKTTRWRVDFVLRYADGRREWREVKGLATRDYLLKRKLFDELHPDRPVRVFTQKGKHWREI